MAHRLPHLIAASLCALLLSGCSLLAISNTPSAEPGPPAAQMASSTTQPTATSLLVTVPTRTAPPDTPSALPTEAQPASAATPTPQMVLIFLIGVDDNGASGMKVGCGDSAIGVQAPIAPTEGVLKAALAKLLSIKDRNYGESGLYNALYQSDLQVKSVNLKEGKATIYLTGSLLLGGECDNPRVQAQLEQTALQFSTVKTVDIYINDKALQEMLSLK